ncbi:hypothetical protein EG328_012021 [Venturia inaequalis]|uniref:Uncharacterized protein n=1 Tax=Venturia inaequalis TaxID=5025 RepID=A0A8H3V404_VENIN|nr:hypothetical protein EG328_012021 [Venturia inaequalis]
MRVNHQLYEESFYSVWKGTIAAVIENGDLRILSKTYTHSLGNENLSQLREQLQGVNSLVIRIAVGQMISREAELDHKLMLNTLVAALMDNGGVRSWGIVLLSDQRNMARDDDDGETLEDLFAEWMLCCFDDIRGIQEVKFTLRKPFLNMTVRPLLNIAEHNLLAGEAMNVGCDEQLHSRFVSLQRTMTSPMPTDAIYTPPMVESFLKYKDMHARIFPMNFQEGDESICQLLEDAFTACDNADTAKLSSVVAETKRIFMHERWSKMESIEAMETEARLKIEEVVAKLEEKPGGRRIRRSESTYVSKTLE